MKLHIKALAKAFAMKPRQKLDSISNTTN